ncbi:hypothetical protein LAG90_05675 [Marinilongibacter aquaticus]|uniref:hypothetical protein n=1 Tax=Marinilongibacter aquaticus TaxID=2975157 RepID=UPI0021BDC5A5|nr:hypothetical protein [Marinilongibacter aquaticus]UBM60129.1 hypothetical protein LAG90_05675 [Marinilongibacter aquaticus]
MSNKLANLISYLFFPGLMPTFLLASLYFLCPYILLVEAYSFWSRVILLLFVFLYTFLFPGLIVFWMHKNQKVKDLRLPDRKERFWPYLFSVIFSGFFAYFFYEKSILLRPSAILLGTIALTILMVLLINQFWKISAHATGIAGVLGTFFTLQFKYQESTLYIPFFIALIVAGLVLSARLKLNAHTPGQVGMGFIVGLVFSIFGSLLI